MAVMMKKSMDSNWDNHMQLEGACSKKRALEVVDNHDPFASDKDDEENENNEVLTDEKAFDTTGDGDFSAEG